MGVFIAGVVFVVFMAMVSLFGGSFYSVDQGERAVLTRMGAVVGVAGPGFGWKTPFIEGAYDISVRQLSTDMEGVLSYSQDQQAADLHLAVLWHIPDDDQSVTRVYGSYGSEDGLASRELVSKVPSVAKIVFGQFSAATAISQRANLVRQIEGRVREAVQGAPLVVDSVQLVNIDFSDAYESAVEQRMTAEVQVQQRAQLARQAEQDALATVTRAKADADSAIQAARGQAEGDLAKARAQAQGINLLAEAEANRIRQRGAALRDNPQLVALTTAERWNGQLPQTMVPGSAVPFLDMGRSR